MGTKIIDKISRRGLAFKARHEGKVLRAYRCPAGVITIGYGFTMGSRIFAEWWRARHGRGLQMGDTMSDADAIMLLETLANQEYGKAFVEKIRPKEQHHLDTGSSVLYNCGIGAAGWRWAQALKNGQIGEAARLLSTTAVTGGGVRLPGLVRRRHEEARLLEFGDYGDERATPTLTSIVDHWDDFVLLGYDPNHGHKSTVEAFQRDHSLTVDGLIGPATRAALKRAVDAKRAKQTATAGGGAGAAGGAGGEVAMNPEGVDGVGIETATWALGLGVTAVVAIIAITLIWRYRGPLFGWLPEPVKDFFEDRGITIGRRVRT